VTNQLPGDPPPEMTMTRVSSGQAARRGIALMCGLLLVIVAFVLSLRNWFYKGPVTGGKG